MKDEGLKRRQVLWLGSAAVASMLVDGCDTLVLPAEGIDLGPPSNISSNADFYVYWHSDPPDIDEETWTMEIMDNGVVLASLNRAYLQTLVPRDLEHTLQCIGSSPRNRLISNAIWQGLPFVEIMEELGIKRGDGNVEIRFECADDYHTTIPINDLDTPIWLMWQLNGEPMPLSHGGPARMIVPGRYGTKNCKVITKLDFINEATLGYWESGSWDNDAIYKTNAFVLGPGNGATLDRGETAIYGTAFAGSDPVVRVEITDDGGETWTDCTLDYAPGANRWVLWSHNWQANTPGDYTLRTRVTTESGDMSDVNPLGSNRWWGYDGGMEIDVTVA